MLIFFFFFSQMPYQATSTHCRRIHISSPQVIWSSPLHRMPRLSGCCNWGLGHAWWSCWGSAGYRKSGWLLKVLRLAEVHYTYEMDCYLMCDAQCCTLAMSCWESWAHHTKQPGVSSPRVKLQAVGNDTVYCTRQRNECSLGLFLL